MLSMRPVTAHREYNTVHNTMQSASQVLLLLAELQGCGVLDERALASVAYQALQFIHSCHDNGLLYGRLQQQ